MIRIEAKIQEADFDLSKHKKASIPRFPVLIYYSVYFFSSATCYDYDDRRSFTAIPFQLQSHQHDHALFWQKHRDMLHCYSLFMKIRKAKQIAVHSETARSKRFG